MADLVDRLTKLVADASDEQVDAFIEDQAGHAVELRQLLPMIRSLVRIGETNSVESELGQNSKVLGDFRIIREIGRGGMGIVYEAEQLSLSRRVALKILPFAAVLDPRHLQRFKNEAIAAAQLAHPHIVDVHGVGCERGVHFYAMRLIEGETLAAVIEGMKGGGGAKDEVPATAGRLRTKDESSGLAPRDDDNVAGPPRRMPSPHRECAVYNDTIAALTTLRTAKPRDFFRRVAELGIQAAEALDHAHQMGIVHRDIKPSNLMLDQMGKLWITDFGLARLPSDAGMTMTGDLLGTLRYMSPEQAEGKSAVLDHRTDIYSLGATLYELVTLRPALPAEDRQTLLRQIANDEPTQPRKLNAALPAELETILLKAIAKEPGERYPTAKEFANDLGRFRDQKAIKAKPPTIWQRVNKWVRRHRAVAASALVALMLTTLGLAVSTALILRERTAVMAARDDESIARDDADQERQRAESNYLTARQAVGQMLKQVADERLNAIREMKDVRRKLLEDAVVFYTRLIEISPRDAEAYTERAAVHKLLGKLPQMIADHEKAAELKPDDAELQAVLAGDYSAYGATPEELSVALTHARKALDLDRTNHMALYFCARVLAMQGHSTEAREQLMRFEAIAPSTAETYWHLSSVHSINGDNEPALQYAWQAIKIDPDHSQAHSHLGHVLDQAGKQEEALQAFTESLRINPYQVSDGSGAHWRRGHILVEQGKYAEALEDYDRAIDIAPWDYIAYKRRAVAHFHLKHYDQALADVTKAFDLKPSDLSTLWWVGFEQVALCPDENYRRGILQLLTKLIGVRETAIDGLQVRAQLYLAMSRYEDALSDVASADQLLAAQTLQRASDNPSTMVQRAGVQAIRGFALNALGRRAEAEPVLRECLVIRQQHQPNEGTTFNAMSMLGEALLAQDKHHEAELLLLQGYEGLKQREGTLHPSIRALRISEAAQRIIRLYEATEQPEKAREWQEKIAAAKR